MEKCEAFGGYKGIMHNCPWPWDWLGSLQKVLPFKFTFLGKVCEHKPVCKKYYAPRGAMDNSLYNDTFELSNSTGKINWTFDELLLPEERLLYAHPKRLPNETLCDAYKKRTVRPKSWTKDVCELDPNNENNTGFKNFDFVVWMISTINSRVRKIYKRFDGDLKSGNYTLKFLISTTTWFGGDSRALGFMYLSTGFGCILLAIRSLIAHRYKKNVFS
ncbi:Cell cycle control protein 50A [Aphelenchoides besseyi]|nr:Cell cycle control protein 50A [Aphelenchoides besseyi]